MSINNLDWSKLSKSISYSEAIKRSPVTSHTCISTWVTWDEKAEKDTIRKKLDLQTIGIIEVVLPLKVPRGYSMEFRKDWYDLFNKIYNRNRDKNCSWEYLDKVQVDRKILEELGIEPHWDYMDYENHKDYFKDKSKFDDSWDTLSCSLETLTNIALEKLGQKYKNECMAPSLIEAILAMKAIALSGELQYDDDGTIIG